MLEVFVAFTRETNVKDLEDTMDAWALPGLEPVALLAKEKKFHLIRRVSAENLAKDDYILTELGFGPVEETFGAGAELALTRNPEVGLWTVEPGSHVVICRKGIVTHWPTPRSESYQKEHGEAVQFAGYQKAICKILHYRHLNESLPC